MMHDVLGGTAPSLLEITDNQNSMRAADRQLQPIPSLILNNFFDERSELNSITLRRKEQTPFSAKRFKETITSHNVRILIKICSKEICEKGGIV